MRTSQQHPDEQPALLVHVNPPEPDDALDACVLLEPTLALLEFALCELDALEELVAPPWPCAIVPPCPLAP